MIVIDNKEIRNPIEQIKKNMDDIAELQGNIRAQIVYNYNGLIGGTSVTQVNRATTNVPEGVNKGWLVDYTGKLFKITGGNTTTLLIDYYASIKGPAGNTGPQGEQGIQGNPGVGIVSIEKTDTTGLIDTYTITYTNGQQSTFTVTNGADGAQGPEGPQGPQGETGATGPTGPTGPAGQDGQDGLTTDIYVNGQTYTQVDGTITLPDYPTSLAWDDIQDKPTFATVATSGDYDDLDNKPTIPTVNNSKITLVQNGNSVSFRLNQDSDSEITLLTVQGNTGSTPSATLSDIQIGNTVYEIPQGGGSGNSSSGIYLSSADLDTTVNYNKIILISTITLGSNTLAVDDIIIGANKYVGVVTTIGVNPNNQPVAAVKTLGNITDPDLSNYVTTIDLSTALTPYAESANLATVATTGDYDDLLDKPDLSIYAQSANLATVATSGSYADLSNKPTIPNVYNPTITIQKNGTTVDTFRLNQSTAKTINITVPTVTSDLTNDSGYITGITSTDVTNALGYTPLETAPVTSVNGMTGTVNITIPTVPTNVSDFNNDAGYITDSALTPYVLSTSLATVATSGSYNDLLDKPTIPTVSYPVTDVQVDGSSVLDGTVAKITMPTIDYPVTSVNGQTGTVTLSIPTVTSDLNNDSGYITDSALTPYVLSSSLATVATSGSYDDLTNKPSIPAAQVQTDWNATVGMGVLLNKPTLATVATSGSYNDLTDKPTIPEDYTIIELTSTSGTLSAADFAKVVANPNKVIFIYKYYLNSFEHSYYLYFNEFKDGSIDNVLDHYEYMSTMYYGKNYLVDLINTLGVGNYTIYEITIPITSISVNNSTITPVYGNVDITVPTSSDYVDLTSAQTITGEKTFTNGYTHFTQHVDVGGNIYFKNSSTVCGAIHSDLNNGLQFRDFQKNGSYGLILPDTSAYTADKTIATTDQILGTTTETWTFTLSDNSTVTKTVVLA